MLLKTHIYRISQKCSIYNEGIENERRKQYYKVKLYGR